MSIRTCVVIGVVCNLVQLVIVILLCTEIKERAKVSSVGNSTYVDLPRDNTDCWYKVDMLATYKQVDSVTMEVE